MLTRYMHAMCERHTVYIQINSLPAACVHFFPTARFYRLENLSKFVASIRRISPRMHGNEYLRMLTAFSAYEGLLARRPIALKSIVSGTSACLGDLAAQYSEYLCGQYGAATSSSNSSPAQFAVDRRRNAAITSLAAFWNGPLLHTHFNNLERWFPQRNGLRSVVSKTMIDLLVMSPFVYLPLFYTWTGFAYSRNADEIVSKASREYWTSLKASWVIFTPFNFANFYIVPVRHQVTTNVAVSFVWNLTLSCLAAPRASDMKLGDGSGVSRSTHSSLLIASARES